jgi:multiple sugar transport system substrate-binding protein
MTWGPASDPFHAGVTQAMEVFRRQHPRLTVTVTTDGGGTEAYSTKFVATAAADQAPDLIYGWSLLPQTWARQGLARDLDPFIKAHWKAETVRDFVPQLWDPYVMDKVGRYAVPYVQSTKVIYYNKDRFRERGVALPDASWDWERFRAAAARLTLHDQKQWAYYEGFEHRAVAVFVHLNGGWVVDPKDDLRCTLDDGKAIDAGQWVKDRLWADNTIPQNAQREGLGGTALFAQGRVAMLPGLSDVLVNVQNAVGSNFAWDVEVLPRGPARRATHFSADMWLMWRGSKAPEAAWALLDFLQSEDFWRVNIPTSGQEPPRKSLMPLWIELMRTKSAALADKSLRAFQDAKANNYGYREPMFRFHNEALQLINAAHTKAITNNEGAVADTFRQVAAEVTGRMRQLAGG